MAIDPERLDNSLAESYINQAVDYLSRDRVSLEKEPGQTQGMVPFIVRTFEEL